MSGTVKKAPKLAPKSARKAKGDGHLRRAEILQAAELIFVRDGYKGATIRKIADEVGVSSTALYMYFHDRDQIIVEICEGAITKLLSGNTEIASRPIDAVSRVRLMMEAYMRFGLANPNAYRLVFAMRSKIPPGSAEVLRELGVRTYERFRAAVSEVAAENRLRNADAEAASQVLWAACHGVVALRLTDMRYPWGPADAMISTMLDSLFQGLLND